jgi:hypothetical protein
MQYQIPVKAIAGFARQFFLIFGAGPRAAPTLAPFYGETAVDVTRTAPSAKAPHRVCLHRIFSFSFAFFAKPRSERHRKWLFLMKLSFALSAIQNRAAVIRPDRDCRPKTRRANSSGLPRCK